jgi:hypothetical protein
MISRFVEWALDRCFARQEIGRFDNPDGIYLTRWFLLGKRFNNQDRRERPLRIYLHRFHRSDPDVLHDHPWPFRSLILWPGYYEETPDGRRKWYRPLSFIARTAAWAHRVVLKTGRGCWTLVFVGKKEREWGFHCPEGFTHHREFLHNIEQTGGGCLTES